MRIRWYKVNLEEQPTEMIGMNRYYSYYRYKGKVYDVDIDKYMDEMLKDGDLF